MATEIGRQILKYATLYVQKSKSEKYDDVCASASNWEGTLKKFIPMQIADSKLDGRENDPVIIHDAKGIMYEGTVASLDADLGLRTADMEDAMILERIADLLAQMSAKNRKNLCDYIEASKINRSDYARLKDWMHKA